MDNKAAQMENRVAVRNVINRLNVSVVQNLSLSSMSVSEVPTTKFSHLWSIKSFSLLPSDLDFLCCPNFSPPGCKDKWFMKLRPRSVDETTGTEYIGVHLFLRSCEERGRMQVRAKYVISILDAEGDRRFTGECSKHEGRIFKAGTEGHGYKLLAPRDVLTNSAHNLLGENDCLQILCEITVFGDITSSLISLKDRKAVLSDEEFTAGSMTNDFKELLSKSETFDIILKTSDGEEIKAHRFILTARSRVFEAMFEHDTKEKAEQCINVNDLSGNTVKEMINFLYTDNVDRLPEMAGDLLIAADKYDIIKLKSLCEQCLCENITVDNTADLLALADTYDCARLKQAVLDVIADDPTKVLQTESWSTQLGKRPLLYKEAFHAIIKKKRI